MNNQYSLPWNSQLNAPSPSYNQMRTLPAKIQITYLQNQDTKIQKIPINNHPINHGQLANNLQSQTLLNDGLFVGSESKIGSGMDRHMHLLMKEQIDIAVCNYREKMGKVLAQQAKCINKLMSDIGRHQFIIVKQQELIKRMRVGEDKMNSTGFKSTCQKDNSRRTSKSPGKLSLTQRKSTNKVMNRDVSPVKPSESEIMTVEARIEAIKVKVQDMDRRLVEGSNLGRVLLSRADELQQKISSELWARIKVCQQRLNAYLMRGEQKILKIQEDTAFKFGQNKQLWSKVSNLKQQIQDLRQQITHLAARQYNYDSYQLDLLKQDIARIKERLQPKQKYTPNIQEAPSQSQTLLNRQPMPQSLNYSQHLPSQINYSQTDLQHSQLSSLTHYGAKYQRQREQQRVRRSEQWQLQDNGSSFSDEEDQFFYPSVQSSTKNVNGGDMKLEQIFRERRMHLPVDVEVDETGYVKQSHTGMYILDREDNGFQLSRQQLEELARRGVIRF